MQGNIGGLVVLLDEAGFCRVVFLNVGGNRGQQGATGGNLIHPKPHHTHTPPPVLDKLASDTHSGRGAA